MDLPSKSSNRKPPSTDDRPPAATPTRSGRSKGAAQRRTNEYPDFENIDENEAEDMEKTPVPRLDSTCRNYTCYPAVGMSRDVVT